MRLVPIAVSGTHLSGLDIGLYTLMSQGERETSPTLSHNTSVRDDRIVRKLWKFVYVPFLENTTFEHAITTEYGSKI